MALELKFNICPINGCTQLRFSENTGFYSSINLTGYGTPNTSFSGLISAILEVTPPSGITYTIDLFATTIFPTNIENTYYDIPLSSIGNPTSIVDGKWLFKYTVASEVLTYSTSIYKYFYCNSECCVTKMLPKVDINNCDCCTPTLEYKKYIIVWSHLEALKKAAACGDEANFTAIKKIIDKLCLNSGCTTCK